MATTYQHGAGIGFSNTEESNASRSNNETNAYASSSPESAPYQTLEGAFAAPHEEEEEEEMKGHTAPLEPNAKRDEGVQESSLVQTGREWVFTLVEAGRHIDARLRKEIRTHPYRTLAAAAALGYMVHGGVSSRTGRLLLLLGGRYALKAFAEGLTGNEETT